MCGTVGTGEFLYIEHLYISNVGAEIHDFLRLRGSMLCRTYTCKMCFNDIFTVVFYQLILTAFSAPLSDFPHSKPPAESPSEPACVQLTPPPLSEFPNSDQTKPDSLEGKLCTAAS